MFKQITCTCVNKIYDWVFWGKNKTDISKYQTYRAIYQSKTPMQNSII